MTLKVYTLIQTLIFGSTNLYSVQVLLSIIVFVDHYLLIGIDISDQLNPASTHNDAPHDHGSLI